VEAAVLTASVDPVRNQRGAAADGAIWENL
jgi:hypothetical protein